MAFMQCEGFFYWLVPREPFWMIWWRCGQILSIKKPLNIGRWPWLLYKPADYFYGYSPATR